jgi:hypothetical protein
MATNDLLLRTRDTITGVIRVRDRLGDGSLGGERVDGPQGTPIREGRERVIVAGSWIWFRNYLRREKVGEDITLLVGGLVLSLEVISQLFHFQKSEMHASHSWRKGALTQLLLKQSCEQKKLSVPLFRHVGHCRVPAGLEQSVPWHLRGSAIVTEGILKGFNKDIKLCEYQKVD